MNKIESVTIEDEILLIVGSGRIYSIEEYQIMALLYSEEIVKSGLKKIILDERHVEYSPSIMLQMEIVKFYSSEELPEELKSWTVASVGSEESMPVFEFWAAFARSKGYDQWAFSSLEEAKSFMRSSDFTP